MTEHSLSSENMSYNLCVFLPQPNIYFYQQLFTYPWIWKVINVKLKSKLERSFVIRWSFLRRYLRRPFPWWSDCSGTERLQEPLWGSQWARPRASPGETGLITFKASGTRQQKKGAKCWASCIALLIFFLFLSSFLSLQLFSLLSGEYYLTQLYIQTRFV